MSNPLVSFWRQLSADSKLYIHPSDQEILKKHSQWLSIYPSWKHFVSHPEWNMAKPSTKLQVSLIPVPYVGDLLKTKITILMLNPGFLPMNIWMEHMVPEWGKVLWDNLYQRRQRSFIFLEPEFAWHPGFVYWASRFKKTLLRIMESKGIPYCKALTWLAQRVACLQLVGYSSGSSGIPEGVIRSLASVQQAKKFAQNKLSAQVRSGEKLLIVGRRIKTWDLPIHKNILHLKKGAMRSGRFENDADILNRVWQKLGL